MIVKVDRLDKEYKYNNYIDLRKIRKLFKNEPFKLELKKIDINGQIRGCSGFITNLETNKMCYITTELFFDGKSGSGIWGDDNKAVLVRSAKDNKDYTGGINHYCNVDDILKLVKEITN